MAVQHQVVRVLHPLLAINIRAIIPPTVPWSRCATIPKLGPLSRRVHLTTNSINQVSHTDVSLRIKPMNLKATMLCLQYRRHWCQAWILLLHKKSPKEFTKKSAATTVRTQATRLVEANNYHSNINNRDHIHFPVKKSPPKRLTNHRKHLPTTKTPTEDLAMHRGQTPAVAQFHQIPKSPYANLYPQPL